MQSPEEGSSKCFAALARVLRHLLAIQMVNSDYHRGDVNKGKYSNELHLGLSQIWF
jgi:hypothetical protein